jgi:Amt family ammonium transporter
VTGLKRLIKADDSLDVFGVHAIGGIFGALMTGIFNAPSLGGPGSTVDWVKGTSDHLPQRAGIRPVSAPMAVGGRL